MEGVDFTEVFSPVVKHSSIRILLAITVQFNLELHQLDVKIAFLHGELDEVLYMDQPPGFVKPGEEHLVCLLHKSLYGLKQSPRQWNKRFDSHMLRIGFQRSKFDRCVYLKKGIDDSIVYLLLYVDDMLLAAKHLEDVVKVKSDLEKEFEMKDLGQACRILGMDILRDRDKGSLRLLQEKYLTTILGKFGMLNCRPLALPLGPEIKLSAQTSPQSQEEKE